MITDEEHCEFRAMNVEMCEPELAGKERSFIGARKCAW